jgi:phosphatidylglycerophosphate synthase
MDIISRVQNHVILNSRRVRNDILTPLVKPCTWIPADLVTVIGFLVGIAAVYYLFDTALFILLMLGNYVFDMFDGVLARLQSETVWGKYLDHLSDNLLVVLMLLQVFYVMSHLLSAVVGGLYLLHLIIYAVSQLKAPVFYFRLPAFLLFAFGLYEIAAVLGLVFTVYGLSLQLHHFTRFNRSKKAR